MLQRQDFPFGQRRARLHTNGSHRNQRAIPRICRQSTFIRLPRDISPRLKYSNYRRMSVFIGTIDFACKRRLTKHPKPKTQPNKEPNITYWTITRQPNRRPCCGMLGFACGRVICKSPGSFLELRRFPIGLEKEKAPYIS